MILSFNYQLMMFFVAVAMGGIMGISYDVIRITRRVIKRKGIIVQAEDALYWLAAAIWAFLVILDRFDGDIRLFNVSGIGIGMAVYFSSLSKVIMLFADRFIRKCKITSGRILKPCCRILSVVADPVKKLIKLVGKTTKKVLHLCKVCAKLKMRHFVRDIKTVFKK